MSRTRKSTGAIRIIGGDWRGRRLPLPAATPVRPTPDRVRETVFNWLGPSIAGRRCLDLFAGSGAFGLEALSRGAAEVVMVERDRALADALEARLVELATDRAVIVRDDALRLLAENRETAISGRYSLVFLDPPYRLPVEPVIEALESRLDRDAMIYVERPVPPGLPALTGYRWHRQKKAGNIEFGLAVPA